MISYCLTHHAAHKNMMRNRKTWHPAFDDVVFITPTDDHTPGTIGLGTSCFRGVGEGFMLRVRYAIGMLAKEKVGALMDYDIVLPPTRIPDDVVKDGEMLCSEVFHDDYYGKYAADVYGHSPTIATGKTWQSILDNDFDDGSMDSKVSDRWLALCAKRAGVEFKRMAGGFSKDGAWNDYHRELARQSGAVIFHGVKTDADFIAATCTPAYRAACKAAKI